MKTLETNLSAPVSAHTPGPLTYAAHKFPDGWGILRSDGQRCYSFEKLTETSAVARAAAATCSRLRQWKRETLRAAAPELLPALKIGLRHVEYHTSALGDNPTAELMRAAIAKAEGRAP